MTFQQIPGVRVKYRTVERDGRRFATATIWFDDEAQSEIATLDLELLTGPGDEHYQRWVDTVSAAFSAWLSRRMKLGEITTKRRKPRYEGE